MEINQIDQKKVGKIGLTSKTNRYKLVDKDFDILLSFLIVVPFFLVGLPTLPNCVPFFPIMFLFFPAFVESLQMFNLSENLAKVRKSFLATYIFS